MGYSNRVLLFIHGLENKPPKPLLKKWYKQSLKEGFERIGSTYKNIPFEVIYWADLLYEKPLNYRIKDENNPLFLDEPYSPAYANVSHFRHSDTKKRYYATLEKWIDKMFLGKIPYVNQKVIVDFVLGKAFKDLHTYYNSENLVDRLTKEEGTAKDIIRARLKRALLKHKGKEIFLIAHSMGSIIAFDVLASLDDEEFEINTFVTIGSPLGLAIIKKAIFVEQQKEYGPLTKVSIPMNIKNRWLNLYDIHDKVAINFNLADDFCSTDTDLIIEDIEIINDYISKFGPNPHKSFGYLRSPELARSLNQFIKTTELPFYFKAYYFIKDKIKIIFASSQDIIEEER